MNEKKQITFEVDDSEFIPGYLRYLNAQQAIQIIIGNTGSGKSGFFYKRIILFMLAKKYFRIIFVRKVAESIRMSIFQGLKDTINEWGIDGYFKINEQRMEITCRLNGNKAFGRGMDQPGKLKSVKDPSHVFWDEFDEAEIGDFAELRRRLRTQKVKKTQFWAALNPVAGWWGMEYFFPDEYHSEMPIGELEAKTADTLIVKTSYHDNPFIDVKEMTAKNKELAELDENNWIVYEKGNWGKLTTGGEFYKTFRKRLSVDEIDFIPFKPVHISFDFNILPYMTMLAAQISSFQSYFNKDKKQFYPLPREGFKQVEVYQVNIFNEYCLEDPENTTEACIEHFIEDYGAQVTDVVYYGDAMGNKRQEGTGNKTEFKKLPRLLQYYGISDQTYRVNPSILRRRKFMSKIFALQEITPGVIIQIIIHPRCKLTIADFENVKLGPEGKLKQIFTNKKTGQKYQKYGHTSDTADYLLSKAFSEYFKSLEV